MSNNRPSHKIVMASPRGEDKKAYWREIGVAFTNRDGSLNLRFEAVPTDFNVATIQLRDIDEKNDS